jgi:hypothetical protein
MDVGRGAGGTGHGGMGGDLFHPGAGLVVLLAITVLNVYKPRGLTPYGWRKQQEERARLARRASIDVPAGVSSPTGAGLPRGSTR